MRSAEERAEDRRQKREENRQFWATHPSNANNAWMQRQAELKAAAEIPVELPPEPSDSGALSKLRRIMANPAEPLHRRLDCAETILQFELAPAALAGATDAQAVAATSYRFLLAVSDAPDTPEPLRFKALRCVAAIQNARAKAVDPTAVVMERRMLLAAINSERRAAIVRAGSWPVPSGIMWHLDWCDTFEEPPGLLSSIGAEQKQMLLEVEARGRDDVGWRVLLASEAG